MKTHYYDEARNNNACGQPVTMRADRTLRINTNTFAVDCGSCILRNSFQEAHQKTVIAKHEAFMAQEPRQFMEPWHSDKKAMRCSECGNGTFRMGDRTCMGHYQNYVCVECGHAESRLTETGMSF